MRAVVIREPGRPEVTEVPYPEPGPGQVLLRVSGCGLCGTDLHLLSGDLPPVPYPITPGHEFAGTVVATGADVTGVSPGVRVAVDPNLPCGTCRWCRAGRSNICRTWDAIGISRPGGFAEYVVVAEETCYPLPDAISETAGAMIEPLSCAVHGINRLPRRPGDHYLVYGAGTMGLLIAALARNAGAAAVSMVDLNRARLEFAESYAGVAVATAATEFAEPDGFDVVIDATGAIPAIEDGLGRVRKGGTFLQFGVSDPHATARFSPYRVYHEEIDILGSMAVHHTFQPAIDLVAGGAIDVEPLVSDQMPLADYANAVERVRNGTGRKIQIVPR